MRMAKKVAYKWRDLSAEREDLEVVGWVLPDELVDFCDANHAPCFRPYNTKLKVGWMWAHAMGISNTGERLWIVIMKRGKSKMYAFRRIWVQVE